MKAISGCSYPSWVEVTDTGQELLVVYYNDWKCDWDEAIDWAVKHHNLSKPVQTIAFPKKIRSICVLKKKLVEVKNEDLFW